MIAKWVSFLLCLTALSAQSRPFAEPQVYPGHTGLTLIGLATDGFAIAADGAQLNADGTVSEVKKVFQIGKTGAVVLAGNVSVQDPVTRPVRGEFNAGRITELWLNAHPDVTFENASRELSTVISQAGGHFFAHRNPGAQAGRARFTLIFLDYAGSKPSFSGWRYFMPTAAGQPMRTEKISPAMQPGEIWMFGLVKLPQELLTRNSSAVNVLKDQSSIAQIRSSRAERSAEDFAAAFDTMLRAAESPQGHKSQPARAVIGPPNRVATITEKRGFAFLEK